MAASKNLTASERVMRAQLAAHTRWAKTPNRKAAMEPLRRGFVRRFEDQVDPDRTLPPDVRAKLADSAKSAYFKGLALKSAQARRKKAGIEVRRFAA